MHISCCRILIVFMMTVALSKSIFGFRLGVERSAATSSYIGLRSATSLNLSSSGSGSGGARSLRPIGGKEKSPSLLQEEMDRLQRCMIFLDASPEPFHVVQTCIKRLTDKGFVELNEKDLWRRNKMVRRGGKYFFTRNGSTFCAFVVGEKYESGSGFKIIGAHTDSPNLKLKPKSKKSGSGLVQLAVECYGGGLWHTWFDRELSVAGRVIIKGSGEGSYQHRLLKIDESILRIPNLCIHLKTPEEREAFKINKEENLVPILCEEVEKGLSGDSGNDGSTTDSSTWRSEQSSELIELITEKLELKSSEDIVDFELSLYDTQKSSTSGIRNEFLCSSRIDNLASCFVALEVIESYSIDDYKDDIGISMIALFDHEEVGSESNAGAGSTLMRDAVQRISNALDSSADEDSEVFKAALAKSMILSVDMAHAVHPNYASKHEKAHSPMMNRGVVIKTNNNQRYASNGLTSFLIREISRRCEGYAPVQEFVVRNDCPCGSTIGPVISANTGIRAVDLGMPMLSMHSIREMSGSSDLTHAFKLFTQFYKNFFELDKQIDIK